METVPKDLKKLSDLVDEEVVEKTVYNAQNTKVINLENKIPDASTSIQTNQYSTNKQNLEKKIEIVENKSPDISVLVTTAVFNTKISVADW